MYILKQIIKLIRLLHAEEGSLNIAFAISLSIFPAFAGFMSIFGLLTLLLVIVFRVQMGAYFLGFLFFSIISLLFLSPINAIGLNLLTAPSLEPLWTQLYTWPLMHWLKFNHTMVMGGQVLALILFPFCLIAFKYLVEKYQRTVVQKLKNTKLYKGFVKTSFFLNYNNILESIKN